jgi:hypothetical protein
METIIFILANIVDILTTQIALLNPDAYEVSAIYGPSPSFTQLLTVKTIGVLVILLFLQEVKYRREVLIGSSLFFLIASANNAVIGSLAF